MAVVVLGPLLAVISKEELVYKLTDPSKAIEPNADQFSLEAGDAFYLFGGITDHFIDPLYFQG